MLILTASYFYKSYALYEEKKNFDAINGTVEEAGDIYFAYYVDGTISRSMPNQNTGYTLDEEKSNCNNGVTVSFDYGTWEAKVNYTNYISSTNTRTKCTLYFNKTFKTISTILGNIEVNSYIPDFTKSACDDDACESHEKGIYETTDYDGNPTYYYRGSVENNYVKFAGYYWRIIRINSNGSIRMIYDGTIAHDNGESSEDRQYTTIQFNSTYTDNMYVGYMYTSGDAHGLSVSSVIKTVNDQFYMDKLVNYVSKFDVNAGFCGDRAILNLQNGVGMGTVTTYYKSYLRIVESSPSIICENESNLYTVSSALNGNKALTYPIGLISADEAMLAGHAGGVFDGMYNQMSINIANYLYTNTNFWTMIPAGGYNPFGSVNWATFVVHLNTSGSFDDDYTHDVLGLRPVINIRSDVKLTGSGMKTDPYEIL